MKMLWAKPIFNDVGLIFVVRCHVIPKLKGGNKIWLLSEILLKKCR
jgi:hypothetical protein